MKQTMRKILAVLVVLSIVLSVGIIAMTGSAAETVVFEETFDTAAQANWAGITRSTLENGKLHMAAVNRTNNGEWITDTYADYTVEADVQFDEVGGSISGSTATAGIMGRANPANLAATKGDGYEFALYVSTRNLSVQTSVLKVRLYERGNDASFGSSTTVNVADLLGEGNAPYNGIYHLKMVFKGSSIKCYINDVLAFDETDTSRTAGYSGVRSSSCTAWVDNFKITTETTGASSAPVSSTVSSAVSSTTSTPAGPLFFDDFNTGTLADHVTEYGWSNSNTGVLVDGRYFVNAEQHTSRYNYLKNITALNPHFSYSNCTTNDYTVEADVQFKDYLHNSFIGLVSRVTAATSNGYEFGIALSSSQPGARLRRVSGNEILGDGSIIPLTELGINKSATDTYHLKMTVLGNRIVCYVDGVKAYDVTDTAQVKGVPAIRVSGGTTSANYSSGYFDNFKVTTAVIDDTTSSSTSSTVTSSAPTSSSITSSDDVTSGGKYHFEDNFNSGSIHADWAADTGSVVNGVYHLNVGGGAGNFNWVNTTAAKNLTDFAVQGDFSILSANNGGNQPTAGISIRTQACTPSGPTGNKGYEFTLTYAQNTTTATLTKGTLYVRLYERGSTDTQIAASTLIPVEDILGEGNAPIDGTYTLRAEMIGNRIKCFINGYLAFDLTDNTWASGAFALCSTINEIKVDNLVVDEISAFTTGLPPVSGGGDIPTYTYPEGVYYQDDFSTEDFANKGWNRNLTTIYGQVKMYDFTGAYLTQRPDMIELTDYTVEAWVTMDNTEPQKTSNKGAFLVARAPAANKGYEFGLYYAGSTCQYRLYDRTTGDELAVGPLAFAYNESYRLRLVVNGNQLYGYFGDQLVMSYEDNQNRNLKGTAGMRQLGYAVYYDNYIVRESTEDEKNGVGVTVTAPQADKNGIYFADNFNTKASLFGTTWNNGNATIENGKMYVDKDSEANLGGNPGFAMLKDYVVQADITISNMKPTNANIDNNIVSLVARGNYEFGIVYGESGSGYLRLYDRTNKKPLTDNHTFKVENGKTYTISLMVEGNKLRAFMNGELIFEKTDSALTDGAMGVRTLYTTTHFDNFVVRKITAADRTAASINTGTTPNTGDTVVYVAMAAAAMLLAAAVLLLSRRRAFLR